MVCHSDPRPPRSQSSFSTGVVCIQRRADDVVAAALHLLKLLTDDVDSLVAAKFNDDDDVLHMVNGHLRPEADGGEALSLPVVSRGMV